MKYKIKKHFIWCLVWLHLFMVFSFSAWRPGNVRLGSSPNFSTTTTDSLKVKDNAHIDGTLAADSAKFGGATHYTAFETDGSMVFNGDATVWEALGVDATAINPPGQGSDPDWDNTNGGWLFDASGTEILFIITTIPHAFKEGTNIIPHVHWQPTSTDTGHVLWRTEFKWTNITGTDAGSFDTVDLLDSAEGTSLKHQEGSFAAYSGSGKTIESILTIKFSRIGGDGDDTYPQDVLLKRIDVHYEIDMIGSRQEHTK